MSRGGGRGGLARPAGGARPGDRHHRLVYGKLAIVMGVNSVTAGDGSIVIGGTATDPTVETGTLDVIASLHPPAANWSNNSKKITSLANGSAATDAAALGQVVQSVAATDTSIVVGGTATAPTLATGTLDVIAADHAPAANWSNNSKKITSLANGSAASDAAAFGQIPTSAGTIGGLVAANNLSDVAAAATAFANISPLTTKGDLIIENATPAPARLAVGSAGQVLGVASGLPAWGTGMTLLAATPVAGYTLVNGTGTIITWTAPNDGLLHRVILLFLLDITSNETGGTITFNVQMPNGTNLSHNAAAGGGAASAGSSIYTTFVNAGQAAALVQSTALTGGAAILWAEIWGS